MSDYYVLLTGAKNNAGDYLIKERAISLLRRHRPDRELVDLDGWRPISDADLEVVNGAKALLLTGGPSVRPNMRPDVYALRDDLDDIEVPITTFGVGWRGPSGDWALTRTQEFTPSSRALLDRVRADGLRHSVRDYHTLNVLGHAGLENVTMTGCPALYATDGELSFEPPENVGRVSVSIGVRFATSPAMWRQTVALLGALRNTFPGAEVVAVFHHALDPSFVEAYGGRNKALFNAQTRLVQWLEAQGISFEDISGSAENLERHYETADLHVGYRVHAHIHMTSVGKPSLLLAEDSRGSALQKVLGGHVIDAIERSPGRVAEKLNRMLRTGIGDLLAPTATIEDALIVLRRDYESNWSKARSAVAAVNNYLPTMEAFLSSLP